MPLFRCTGCGCVENTAVGDFWNNRSAPKCSECSTGKWHGRFEKVQADPNLWEPDLPYSADMIRMKGMNP